ncbi:hypothetical protein [Helicobacter sp. 13S00477-4]|uniref:hypothetical protein n=1 Tax=Helicobacter sp. 13S00477-4 TaxID=1905759 RepID=UPI000BA5D368|nr:hypothetical protein [Helicobacter sp. 13S00477-4]
MINFKQKAQFSYIEKFLIKWQTRSLGTKIDTTIIILSVLVYIGRPDLEGQLDRAKGIVKNIIKPQNLALKIFDRIMIRVLEYTKDEKIYMQDRDKALNAIVQDIQFYSIVLDMLDGKGCDTQRDIIRSVVQKTYDEEYCISAENKRILEYQEQAFR